MTPIITAQVLAPFVSPALALAGVIAVSAPVAIHLLSRWRRRPEPWGAMRFLLEAYRKQKRRMRLEQWLLLLMRCLIVLMLGMALARPRLVGALGGWLGGLDTQGRIVNIVVDDSLSTHAPDGPDATRFDRLRSSAEAVIQALNANDRATLWRAGRPAGPVILEPTSDREALSRALQAMTPGYSRPDLPEALSQIDRVLQANDADPAKVLTVVLSDFVRSSDYLNRPLDLPAESLARLGTLFVSRPLAGLNNTQVLSVEPRRRVLVMDDRTGDVVPVRVSVRRFSEVLTEGVVPLTVSLIDPEGRSLSTVKRQAVFTQGQGVASISVGPVLDASWRAHESQGGSLLTVRAQLDTDIEGLTADDQSFASVELRSGLRVAVVDEPAGRLQGLGAGLTPGQWLTLALKPEIVGRSGPVEVVPLSPATLNDPQSYDLLDAVLILRPDLLFESSWGDLASYAQHGGLVWVFTPPKDGSALWTNSMARAFDIDWRIGMEPVSVEAVNSDWRLSAEPIAAPPLQLLAADWQALAQPVGISRRLPVEAGGSESWISLQQATPRDGSEPGTQTNANSLLIHHKVGRGSLLLLSTALDTRWTNLPTKPLFVPLIHETLRGVLGSADSPGRVQAVAGDQPLLDADWSGVEAIDRLVISGDLIEAKKLDSEPGDTLLFTTGERGTQLAKPLNLPGVYQAMTDSGPCRLVVNHDPEAGDTREVSEETLTHWLERIGDWSWLDENDPAAVFRREDRVSDIGWALLWVLLGIVLIETFVGRRLSHADVGPGRSLTGRIWRSLVRLRTGGTGHDGDSSRRGRAA